MLRAQAPQHFEAVESREANVEHDQIEGSCAGLIQSRLAIVYDNRIVSGFSQRRCNLPRHSNFIFDNEDAHGKALETDRELCSEQMIVAVSATGFVLETILHLQLSVRRETISACDVDPTQVLAPAGVSSRSIVDITEKLLVPSERSEELRRKFVFRFNIISKCVCISASRHFEAGFIQLGPYLQMAPGEARILAENKLAVIADIAVARQSSFGFGSKIRHLRWRRDPDSTLRLAESRHAH